MPFSPLASIALSEIWQVTPVTDGNFFRFTCSNNVGFTYLLVAQAQVGDTGLIELFESRRYPIEVGVAFLTQLIAPPVIGPEARRLAVRGLSPRSVQAPSLNLDIEASKMIINPQGVTTKEIFKELQQADALSRELSPSNLLRNGGTVFNRGSKTMWVGFGIPAEKSSPNRVVPGGMMDITPGFTGAINIIFDAADANLNMKAVSQEMVS